MFKAIFHNKQKRISERSQWLENNCVTAHKPTRRFSQNNLLANDVAFVGRHLWQCSFWKQNNHYLLEFSPPLQSKASTKSAPLRVTQFNTPNPLKAARVPSLLACIRITGCLSAWTIIFFFKRKKKEKEYARSRNSSGSNEGQWVYPSKWPCESELYLISQYPVRCHVRLFCNLSSTWFC